MGKDKGFLDDLFSGFGKAGSSSGGGGSNWLDFSDLTKATSNLDGKKLATSVVNTMREAKARRTYKDLVDFYGPDVAEAAAAAVRAGRDPAGIIERAERQLEERVAREEMLRNPPPVHGSARWATQDELAKRLKGRDEFFNPRSILLGAVDDPRTGDAAFIHWDGEGHLVTLAPSRAGKSETTIVPNLLRYRGSVIVHDPKGELYELTSKERATFGPVYRINPYNVGTHPEKHLFPQHGFNPLAGLTGFGDARELAGRLFPPDPRSPAFFIEDAMTFIPPLIWFAKSCLDPAQANLHHVCKLMAAGPIYLRDQVLPLMERSGIPEVVSGARAIRGKYAGNDRGEQIPTGLQTFFSTCNTKLMFWLDGALGDCVRRNDVDFAALKRGSGVQNQTVTVYVTLPFRMMKTSAPFLKMAFTSALTAMEEGPPPPIPVLFLIDEFLALGPFPEFESALREVGGYGVRLWFFLQEIGKLQEHYPGTSWQAFFNTSVKQFFGINEPFTAELISRLLSSRTVALRSTNESANVSAQMGRDNGSAGVNVSSGESISLHGRPLMTPDEVTELLSAWNDDSTRASIVQMTSPPRPVQAMLASYKKSGTCMKLVGPWMGPVGSKGGYPA